MLILSAGKRIREICDRSKRNYGAPKITIRLRRRGEVIAERTVGKYMREMGIKAQWVKPRTVRRSESEPPSPQARIIVQPERLTIRKEKPECRKAAGEQRNRKTPVV